MEHGTIRETGYSFQLVNIDCIRSSTHFNVVMQLDESIGELLPFLVSVLPGCTYAHGTGVINLMDGGHIVAIYPDRITITDVADLEAATLLCCRYFDTIGQVRINREQIQPRYQSKLSITVLDILRHLPQTNCGQCRSATCMAFAARVFRREATIGECIPLLEDTGNERFQRLIERLRANGYSVPTP